MEETSLVPVKRLLQGKVTDGPHETPNFIDEGVPFLVAYSYLRKVSVKLSAM